MLCEKCNKPALKNRETGEVLCPHCATDAELGAELVRRFETGTDGFRRFLSGAAESVHDAHASRNDADGGGTDPAA